MCQIAVISMFATHYVNPRFINDGFCLPFTKNLFSFLQEEDKWKLLPSTVKSAFGEKCKFFVIIKPSQKFLIKVYVVGTNTNFGTCISTIHQYHSR